jgi:carboxypeptidase C (cathepsin A)
VLISAIAALAAADDAITSLPGLSSPLAEKNYAGAIPVGSQGGDLFYWLSEARSPAADADVPLLIWLNGGPGSSSLIGLFFENGPYTISSSAALKPNPFSWNEKYHTLFVDQPVGTGFASCPTDACYATTLTQVGSMFVDFLNGIYARHAELAASPLFITGESFAGKYIPYIADAILAQPFASRLQGLAIGNPEVDTLLQYPQTPPYLRALGLIGQAQADAAVAEFSNCSTLVEGGRWRAASEACEAWLDALVVAAGSPFRYDVRLYHSWFDDAVATLGPYLNSAPVRAALHAGNRSWNSGDGETAPNKVSMALVEEIEKPGALALLGRVLERGVRTVVYDGNFDGSPFNHLSTERALEHMPWSGAAAFNAARHRPLVLRTGAAQSGTIYTRAAAGTNLSFAVIPNAGHLVPHDQPALALAFIEWFVQGT